jgi:hypothetical protein
MYIYHTFYYKQLPKDKNNMHIINNKIRFETPKDLSAIKDKNVVYEHKDNFGRTVWKAVEVEDNNRLVIYRVF